MPSIFEHPVRSPSERPTSRTFTCDFDQLNLTALISDGIVYTKAAYDAFVASKAGTTGEVSA